MLEFKKMKRVTIQVIGAYLIRETARDSKSLLPMGWIQFRERLKAEVKDYVARLKVRDIELIKNHANHSQRVTIFTGDIMKDRARLVNVITAAAEGLAGEVHPSSNRRAYVIHSFDSLIKESTQFLDRFSGSGVFDE